MCSDRTAQDYQDYSTNRCREPRQRRIISPCETALLPALLDASGVIEGANQREQAHLVVRVTGADGYVAAIALGEISPLLADRPILLADELNGTPLPDHALRLVVPGDRLGARSVRDVVRIEIE
jgi:DMSO/TMAO reductase YedYZ molybdopterin-dependent catalytic subunit